MERQRRKSAHSGGRLATTKSASCRCARFAPAQDPLQQDFRVDIEDAGDEEKSLSAMDIEHKSNCYGSTDFVTDHTVCRGRLNMPPKSCPLHPGEVLRRKLAKWKRKAKITYLARITGVSRSLLSRFMNGRTAVKARLAICLARALHVSAESWLRVQATYDLWHARRPRRAVVKPCRSWVLCVSRDRYGCLLRELFVPAGKGHA